MKIVLVVGLLGLLIVTIQTQSPSQPELVVSAAEQQPASQSSISSERPSIDPVVVDSAPETHTEQPVSTIPQQPQASNSLNEQSVSSNPQQPSPQPSKSAEFKQELTDKEKEELLNEERIRVQLHENKDLKLDDVINIHPDVKAQMASAAAKGAKQAYERVKKEMQEKKMNERLERQRLMEDQELNRTQKLRMKERLKVSEMQDRLDQSEEEEKVIHNLNQYKFQLEPHVSEDFIMKLTVDHPIFLRAFVYINTDGVYARTKDVNDEGPLRLRITENQYSLVSETEFYFQEAVMISAKANQTYHFNFINSDKHRIVIVEITDVIESNKIETSIKSSEFESFSLRTHEFKEKLIAQMRGHDDTKSLQLSNRERVNAALSTYSWYMLGETVIVMILCLLQVEGIRRMLSSSSVV